MTFYFVITASSHAAYIRGPGGRLFECFDVEEKWKGASEKCASNGGHLAALNTAKLNVFFKDHLSGKKYWIGYTYNVTVGEWKWVNDRDLSATDHKNWNTGEPNNLPEEACTVMDPSGKWNNVVCTENVAFLCEFRKKKHCAIDSVYGGRDYLERQREVPEL